MRTEQAIIKAIKATAYANEGRTSCMELVARHLRVTEWRLHESLCKTAAIKRHGFCGQLLTVEEA